ncbi:MAG: hypothetical protein ACLFS1_10485, partial [Opitutales bacterium]
PAPKELLQNAEAGEKASPPAKKSKSKPAKTETAKTETAEAETAKAETKKESSLRKWTNQEGRSVRASLEAVNSSGVELRLPDGQIAEVPLKTLSSSDQRYVMEETQYRVWTSQDGQTLIARMENGNNDSAEVVTPDGNSFEIPMQRLTEEDRKFVRSSN